MNPPGRMISMSATLQIDSPVYETQARHINHCRYVADAASIRVTVFCGIGEHPFQRFLWRWLLSASYSAADAEPVRFCHVS